MSILQGDESTSDNGEREHKHHDTSLKSVTFVPLESTRIYEEKLEKDNIFDKLCDKDDDILSRKTIESLYNTTLEKVYDDKVREREDSKESKTKCQNGENHERDNAYKSHEKPKSKTENKVTFCDIPREIVSETEVEPEPHQSSPSIIITEEIILAEPPPGHWPLKRSASLESRDNPFQPDGNLSKEADDLLARATIIRDQFIINDQGNVAASNNTSPNHSAKSSPVKSNTDAEKAVIEETVSATVARDFHTAPDKPKQNGKLDDSSVSPETVRPEVNSDGSTNPDEKLRDKKKQQKCCIIM